MSKLKANQSFCFSAMGGDESPTTNKCTQVSASAQWAAMNRPLRTNARKFLMANIPPR